MKSLRLQIQIVMQNKEQLRRKTTVIGTGLKSNPSSNSLIDVKDRKRPEKSKQKQNQKGKCLPFRQRQVSRKTTLMQQPNQYQHVHHPTHPTQNFPAQEYQSKKTANNYNFKNLKNGMNKKPNNKQYYYQPESIRQPASNGGGISINVNIQNMVSNKKQTKNDLSAIISDRSPSLNKKDKSNDKGVQKNPSFNQKSKLIKKKSSPHIIEDFECNEELDYTSRPLKSNPSNSTLSQTSTNTTRGEKDKKIIVDKKPLIFQPTVINYKEELKKFEDWQQDYNIEAQRDMLKHMVERQDREYRVRSTYIDENQNSFTSNARATLIDWMMHVSYEFAMKRDTFHISVTIADKYFANVHNIPRSDWQLVGAASMFIASKLEQFQPEFSSRFSMSTNNKYNEAQIKEMEVKICLALRFNLNPPTFYLWANRMMQNWDTYLDYVEFAKNHPLFQNPRKLLYFRKTDDQSYKNFRMIMQYIDCAILDIETVQYQPQIMVLAFMYLYLGFKYKFFSSRDMEGFHTQSLYLLEDTPFNNLFHCFLASSFQLDLQDLLPQIQYAAYFMRLKPQFDPPAVPEERLQEIDYQEFISYQSYNRSSIKIAINRKKVLL